MRHIIDAVAAQGRGNDSELLHVTKGELAGLDALARKHFGRELPRNPRTGIKEASLFQDWFGSDVGQVLDVAAPVATAFIPGVGPVAAAAMGAGLGAANQGLGKNGTTESALMGGVMGGIGAYGGSGLAEGLGVGATTAAPAGVAATPTAQAGAGLGVGNIAEAAPVMGNTSTLGAYGPAAGSDMAGAGGANLFQGTPNATPPSLGINPAANTFQPGTTAVQTGIAGADNAALNVPNSTLTSQATTPVDKPTNWNYLTSKAALSPATAIGTSAIGTLGIPGAPADTTSTTTSGVNKTLPKAEVYYTPYGERRTRIAAAEGGIMGLNGAYGDYDGAEDGEGVRRYNTGGISMVRSMQPGGAWGDATADLYGVVDKNAPWLNDMQPGGFMGALQPGRMDYEDRKRNEAEAKASEEKAKSDAAAKAQQQQAFQDQWTQRYAQQFAVGGGITNVGFAKGRYLQGPGDGMSDSIPANIDGKQEARLATGEFVVPADVVSGLGNGDSNSGAKQLHAMMDRTRQARTGTKTQGKQINPRKVMPV